MRISWRCISGECEPSRCAPFCKSAEGRSLWHNATQAANTRKEVTQIDAIRLHHSSVLHSGKRLSAHRRFGSEARLDVSTPRGIRLRKSARPGRQRRPTPGHTTAKELAS